MKVIVLAINNIYHDWMSYSLEMPTIMKEEKSVDILPDYHARI